VWYLYGQNYWVANSNCSNVKECDAVDDRSNERNAEKTTNITAWRITLAGGTVNFQLILLTWAGSEACFKQQE
jgi:hypothetical protein